MIGLTPRPLVTRALAPLALSLALSALACGSKPPAPAAAPASLAQASRLVEAAPVRHAPRTVAAGTLKARQQALLASTVPGTLARVLVTRGQAVREGALLLQLDDEAASATSRQAQAALAAARAQLTLAEDGLSRVSAIHAQQGTSEAQLVQARAQRDLAAAQVQAAEAQFEAARVHLAHHALRAPFAGVVTQVPDGIGVMVAPGVPLVTLVATGSLKLETSVTQEEAAELRAGAAVVVTVPASGARSTDATVALVLPVVDPGTNRVPVEIAVPNADGRFRANAYARVELPAATPRDAWRIPAAALVQREGSYAAWVAGADGRARALSVRLLGEDGAAAVVVPADGSAWPAGDRALETPPVGLAEGTSLAGARP